MIFVYEIAETVRVKSNSAQRSMKQETDHAMSSKKQKQTNNLNSCLCTSTAVLIMICTAVLICTAVRICTAVLI